MAVMTASPCTRPQTRLHAMRPAQVRPAAPLAPKNVMQRRAQASRQHQVVVLGKAAAVEVGEKGCLAVPALTVMLRACWGSALDPSSPLRGLVCLAGPRLGRAA
jgi:hypothetical protein